MLDKSVPHYNILMHRPAGEPVPEAHLSQGYRIVPFQKGDETAWARIEASVLEFDSEGEALAYFRESYLPYLRELERRCFFVQTPAGEKVGTATLWWEYNGVRRVPWLHWVAVRPEQQGRGVAKALLAHLLRLLPEMEGDRECYLKTQTWSHRAVFLYEAMGFAITEEPRLAHYTNNEYAQAREVLEGLRAAGR